MEGAAGGSPLSSMLVPLVLMMAVIYFIVIRPTSKQQKQKEAMVSALKKGDRVITSSGIYGTVATVEERDLLLKVAENVKIRIAKSAIGGKISGDGSPEST